PMGRATRGVLAGGGHWLCVGADPSRVQHVAGPLQLSLPGELRRRRARVRAIRRRSRLGHPWAVGMGPRLLPAGRGWASAAGNPLPRPGAAALAVCGLSDRTGANRAGITGPEGARALGGADRPPVRSRSLDCSPAHADARDLVSGRLRMRPVVVGVIVGWLVL